MSSSILIVMPSAFHLGYMGATRRLFHIAIAFKTMGFRVALLAGAMTNPSLQAEVDRSFPGQVIRLGHTGAYPIWIDYSSLMRRTWRALWKFRGNDYYWRRLSWGWADSMNVKHLLKEFYRIEQRPELIWGVGAGYLEGGVAAQQIARALNLPWLFELHDPPRRAGLGPDNRIVKTRFSELLHDAVRVIVTADSYKSSIVRQYQLKHEKVCTIHLSYDGKSITANEKMKEHCFTLAYAGSLSGGRTMKPLLLAITAAFEKQPKMRQMFKLELAGAGAGFDEINQLSPALGLTKNIEYHGLIPGNMVAALLERAVAVIVIENSSKLQVPGKIFEILKVGKAILGLMPQDCEAAKILIQAGLGFIHKANDIKDITETLIRMWQAWREDKVITKPNESFIQGFSAEQLPIKLADALRDYVHIQNFESEIN